MRRILLPLALVALAVGVGTALWSALRPAPAPLPEIPLRADRPERKAATPLPRVELPKGGIYAGVVRDPAGVPIEGATVWLVGFETGEREGPGLAAGEDDALDFSQLPTIGYETAAEGRTDAGGRFSIAADAGSAVRLVAAWRRGTMPALVPVEAPREDIEITLEEAGQFIGRVVDAQTGSPVPGARVTIYLQQPAMKPSTDPGTRAGGAPTPEPLSPFAVAQRWITDVLGERVWGLPPAQEPALEALTDGQGTFRVGPVGRAVQLEFVITHPDYLWTDFDNTGEGPVVRTRVEPGETVERTFELPRGHAVSGRVVDEDTGKGVGGVQIEIESVAQYKEHWWYRFKKRTTVSRPDGSFRVAGLTFGPYTATLRPPSGGIQFVPSVPEGAQGVVWEIEHRGVLLGRIAGLERPERSALVILEAVGADAPEGRQQVLRPALDADGTFRVPGLRPGDYRAWVQAGGQSSLPQPITIAAQEETEIAFELGGGGTLALEVVDDEGRVVDPARVELLQGGEDGEPTPLGTLVTRGGRLRAEGLAPGRYRARVVAPEYLPTLTEPFTLADGQTSDLGVIVVPRRAWLRITDVRVTEDPRADPGLVQIEVREGAEGDFRPLPPLTGRPVPLRPGAVTVRAQSGKGFRFERTWQVGGGETLEVAIELAR